MGETWFPPCFHPVPTLVSAPMEGIFKRGVREVVRDEAATVARQLAECRGLANQTNRRLERLQADLDAERSARVDDLAVLVELITAGWKSVEERLDRIEQRLADAPHLREVA